MAVVEEKVDTLSEEQRRHRETVYAELAELRRDVKELLRRDAERQGREGLFKYTIPSLALLVSLGVAALTFIPMLAQLH